jgi:hypothetical protein
MGIREYTNFQVAADPVLDLTTGRLNLKIFLSFYSANHLKP